MAEMNRLEGLEGAADLLENLPSVLAKFRNEHFYSQAAAASEIGVHRNTLSSLETGERTVSHKIAKAIISWMSDVQRAEEEERGY